MSRTLPCAIESEQAVLGGLMLDPNKVEAIAERLTEDDFFRADHRSIFRAIMELSGRGEPFDAVTMGDWFIGQGVGHSVAAYTTKLADSTPSAHNILAYAAIVREKSVARQVIDMAHNLAERGFSGESAGEELLSGAIAELMALQKVEARSEYTLRQAMTLAYASAQKAKETGGLPGIPSGLAKLDHVLGGWHDSDLVIVGARPSHGKTALLLNFALSSGVACGVISAEQPAEQIGARVMSIESKVDASKMRNGQFDHDDLRKLDFAVHRLVDRNCHIYDRSAPTIADVQRMARKWKQQNKIRVLFVDYVQRIEGVDRKLAKHERVGEVARGLKDLARDLEIPVIALAQVRREVENRADKRPGMGDLADSSELEKEADQILMLYRDGVYNPDGEDAGTAEISVEKNRHGPTGFVKVAWLAETMRFENLGYDH